MSRKINEMSDDVRENRIQKIEESAIQLDESTDL
jgi:hypothetical protein